MRFKRQSTLEEAFVKYQLKDLGIDEPQAIRSSDFLFANKENDESEEQANPIKAEKKQLEKTITFNAPIER